MPIHEYKCAMCNNQFEELVFGDEVPTCPQCGDNTVTKLMSCSCLHIPGPSRVGQTVTFPKSSGSGCGGCSGGNCSSCK